MIKIFKTIYGMPRRFFVSLFNVFGVRECAIIMGLSMLGYGLYLYKPWVSFSVCGVLILVGGLYMSEKDS